MQEKTVLDLNGSWQLHYYPEEEASRYAAAFYVADVAAQLPPPIAATVPGGFEKDLQRAGVLPADLYHGCNLQQLEPYEYCHFVYVKEFTFTDNPTGREFFCFEGVDTVADVYLNGEQIGHTDNFFMRHDLPAVGLRQGDNRLVVHILPATLEARKTDLSFQHFAFRYNFDSLTIRKPASSYGWDILPRLQSAGLWRPVSLRTRNKVGFKQTYIITENIGKTAAYLKFFYELELGTERAYEYTVEVEGHCGDSAFKESRRVWGKAGKENFWVQNARLWWPRGYGEQNLYHVTYRLLKNGQVVDEVTDTLGIRKVALWRTDVIDADGNGDFRFTVNDKTIFINGTNWVPPDPNPTEGDRRASAVLDLVEDIGCNAIRIWGGGRYEQDSFYSLCDQKGILVWHDFMLACGNYPQTPEFAAALTKETTWAIRTLRQHPSILLWAGDNECDQNYAWQGCRTDAGENNITREVLRVLTLQEDYARPYLPSSPYYAPGFYTQKGHKGLPEEHLWGERKWFKASFYKDTTALFASEIGYHGCPSPASLAKFISPENLWDTHSDEWIFHATSPDITPNSPFSYRNDLMKEQVNILFGSVPETLEQFAKASQISQAEAVKFFIQHFRSRKGYCTGIIWWNICDGWPQISDAVVDYYYSKKLAYHYIKRAQNPVCLMLEERESGRMGLYGVNDTTAPQSVNYRITRADGSVVTEGAAELPTDTAMELAVLQPGEVKELWRIDWDGEFAGFNSFLTGDKPYDLDAYLSQAVALGLLPDNEVFGNNENQITI